MILFKLGSGLPDAALAAMFRLFLFGALGTFLAAGAIAVQIQYAFSAMPGYQVLHRYQCESDQSPHENRRMEKALEPQNFAFRCFLF